MNAASQFFSNMVQISLWKMWVQENPFVKDLLWVIYISQNIGISTFPWTLLIIIIWWHSDISHFILKRGGFVTCTKRMTISNFLAKTPAEEATFFGKSGAARLLHDFEVSWNDFSAIFTLKISPERPRKVFRNYIFCFLTNFSRKSKNLASNKFEFSSNNNY